MEYVKSVIETIAIVAAANIPMQWFADAASVFTLVTLLGVFWAPSVVVMLVMLVPFTHGASIIGLGETTKITFRHGLRLAAIGAAGLTLTGVAYLVYTIALP